MPPRAFINMFLPAALLIVFTVAGCISPEPIEESPVHVPNPSVENSVPETTT